MDMEFLASWTKTHMEDAKALGKPLIIEEFGKELHMEDKKLSMASLRTPFYEKVYQLLQDSIATGGELKGRPRTQPS